MCARKKMPVRKKYLLHIGNGKSANSAWYKLPGKHKLPASHKLPDRQK